MLFRAWKCLIQKDILGSSIFCFKESPAPREQTVLYQQPTALRSCLAYVQPSGECVVYLGRGFARPFPRGDEFVRLKQFIIERTAQSGAVITKLHWKRSEQAANLALSVPQPEIVIEAIKWLKMDPNLGIVQPMIRPTEGLLALVDSFWIS